MRLAEVCRHLVASGEIVPRADDALLGRGKQQHPWAPGESWRTTEMSRIRSHVSQRTGDLHLRTDKPAAARRLAVVDAALAWSPTAPPPCHGPCEVPFPLVALLPWPQWTGLELDTNSDGSMSVPPSSYGRETCRIQSVFFQGWRAMPMDRGF